MPIHRDKTKGCFVFEFRRVIAGRRFRIRKCLPKTWNRAQADSFDRTESGRLYAVATGADRPEAGIEDAVAAYLKERIPQLKDGHGTARELARMFSFYQGRPLSALPDVCRAYAIKSADELSPATIRLRIRFLTSACRWGWKHHNMGDGDPAARVSVPTIKNERQFYISRLEMLRLSRGCSNRTARMAVRIAFYSGMRLSEILRAKRIDGNFVLEDSKNGSPRLIPVHPRLSHMRLEKIRKNAIQKSFRRASLKLGLGHYHFHDLRHSCASEMINRGVDLYTVGAVLGHKSPVSTKRYSHLATESLAAAVLKIGRKVA
jgi:integrase